MSSKLHFDDEDVGPARETSHPRFQELAPDEFFYDVGDEFSPFGNDDGADALSSLEDWYREGGKSGKILRFLKDLLEDWDLPVPKKTLRADAEALAKWCAKDEMHMTYLQSECQAIVATAFGQLKIAGAVEAELIDEARAALRCQLLLADLARVRHPDWEYADLNRERLLRMQTVLDAL